MSREIRHLPAQGERVETGPIQFGDDWAGVFIRGDDAAYYAFTLEAYLKTPNEIGARVLFGLISYLKSCNQNGDDND